MSILYIIQCLLYIHSAVKYEHQHWTAVRGGDKRIIERGYARNQTEVIRQAILAYERMLEEEELMLVHRAVTGEVREIEAKMTPSHSFDEAHTRGFTP